MFGTSDLIVERTEHKGWGGSTDLLGIFDFLVLTVKGELIGVQATTRDNASARKRKIENTPATRMWVVNNRILVVGWDFKKSPGKAHVWELESGIWRKK